MPVSVPKYPARGIHKPPKNMLAKPKAADALPAFLPCLFKAREKLVAPKTEICKLYNQVEHLKK